MLALEISTKTSALILLFVMSLTPVTKTIADTSTHKMTVHQMVNRIINYYPSLRVAKFNVDKAKLENTKVQAQLSWVLSGQTGYSRDVSFVGAATDKYEINAKIAKKLESGSELGLSAGYREEDSEFAFTSTVANPSKTTDISLDYRMPLSKGSDNPAYQHDVMRATTSLKINKLDQDELRDEIARQSIELYYSLADIKLRIQNTHESIKRAEQLKKYVLRNKEIGITENIDLLQTEAKLKLSQANLLELDTVLRKQIISLNKLLGLPWDNDLDVIIRPIEEKFTIQTEERIKNTFAYNQGLHKLNAELDLVDSELSLLRDKKKDKVDLIFSLGARNRSGDTAVGSLNETDTIGGLQLEYQNNLDKTGFDAERLQSQIERNKILETITLNKRELEFEVYSLISEIKTSVKAYDGQKIRKKVENEKLIDARRRFKVGRTDTNQLIEFEGDLLEAELAVKQKQLEIKNKLTLLDLKSGKFWGVAK